MIKKTFTDFHPGKFNLHNIQIDEYLKVVEEQELCAKYGSLLEGAEKNILSIKNVPWFDIGDLPESYDPMKDEAFQVTMRPSQKLPNFCVCKYQMLKGQFNQQKFAKKYHLMGFTENGITQEEVESTLRMASTALNPFHGYMSRLNKIKYLVFISAFILFMICAILAGIIPTLKGTKRNARWFWPLFIIGICIAGIFIANHYFNKRMSYYYRMGHFVLAVLCRAENNRLYLRHGVEMRPGYNGLWVTFEVL